MGMFKTLGTVAEHVPVVGKAVTFWKEKKRLVIEYALLACVVAIAGLALSLWLTKKELKHDLVETQTHLNAVKGRMNALEFSNGVLSQTVTTLKNARANDTLALGNLQQNMEDLSRGDKTVRTRLSQLETSNEAVRNFYDQPVPPELGCLLEPRSCETGTPARTRR